jgi:hypothetical protein
LLYVLVVATLCQPLVAGGWDAGFFLLLLLLLLLLLPDVFQMCRLASGTVACELVCPVAASPCLVGLARLVQLRTAAASSQQGLNGVIHVRPQSKARGVHAPHASINGHSTCGIGAGTAQGTVGGALLQG